MFRFAFLISIALPIASSACADFTGKVVSVVDGDSITVLRGRERVSVRLVDIDAPEHTQPFSSSSKRALEALVKGQTVLVVEHGQDKYHRTLARIYRGDLDVNAEQVRQGMAWVYRHYSADRNLEQIEAEARKQRRGLWQGAKPVPPWVWRKTRAP
jgi:endonuclease YncB( thermonuclease family)